VTSKNGFVVIGYPKIGLC